MRKFIDLTVLPQGIAMIVETVVGTVYRVTRAENGEYVVRGGLFDEGRFITAKTPFILALGESAILGHIRTAAVTRVSFEIDAQDAPPTASAGVVLAFPAPTNRIVTYLPREGMVA